MRQKAELRLNLIVSLTVQIVGFVVNFFTKQAVLKGMGAEYLGLQTVCGNVSDLLNMAFSAIGIVMLVELFAPLEYHDEKALRDIFTFFDRIYKFLSLGVMVVGILLTGAVLLIVNGNLSGLTIVLSYLIYLTSVVLFNRFLMNYYFLIADQKRYVQAMICSLGDVIGLLVEIAVIYRLKTYLGFLLVILLKNGAEAAVVAWYRRKHYPYLNQKGEMVSAELQTKVYRNIKDMVISRIGTLLLYNTDSIIISAVISTVVSGYYSAYYFVACGLIYCVNAIYEAIRPKIGQLSVKHTKKQQYALLIPASLANTFMAAVLITGFVFLVEDFITLWMGEAVLLEGRLVPLMAVNLYLTMIRNTTTAFREAEGLFHKISRVILLRGVLNVVLSFILGYKMGLIGIILATTISELLTYFWYEPYIVLRNYEQSFLPEIGFQLFSVSVVLISVFVTGQLLPNFEKVSWLGFVLKGLWIVAVSGVISGALSGAAYLLLKKRKGVAS